MHPWDRFWRITFPLGAVCVIATLIAVGNQAQPSRFVRGYAPTQPIAFSHKVHAGDNQIPCEYCHTNAERSRLATVPPLQTCMNCHRVVTKGANAKYTAAIQQVIRDFKEHKVIAWQRVYDLPDHVYFDHRPHVRAGLECQTCHGPVEKMDKVRRVMDMRMGNCLDCHRHPREYLPRGSSISAAPIDCIDCHR